MEFLVTRPRHTVEMAPGRRLLGLSLGERARRMLRSAGLTETCRLQGPDPLLLYPGEMVGPASLGRELAEIEPGPDEVIEAQAGEQERPVVILGEDARQRLLAGVDTIEGACNACRSAKTRQVNLTVPTVAVISYKTERQATRMLLSSLQKPFDGVVSRTINRPVSLLLSSFFVNTSLTPNMLSILTFLIALGAVALVVNSHYVWGTLVMQFASILGGCDSEVARLKYQTTKLGGWLNTIFINVSNMLFVLGMGVGLSLDSETSAPWNAVWLGAGVVSFFAILFANCCAKRAQTEEATPFRRFLGRYLDPLVKRDFYFFFLILALLGIPWAIMVLSFVGAVMPAFAICNKKKA